MRQRATGHSCRKGRMEPIVLPSFALPATHPNVPGGAENAGVRKASSQGHLIWCSGENGKRYQFHQPASNDCSACSPDLSLLSSQSNSGIPALDPMTTVVATLARARMCAYIYFH